MIKTIIFDVGGVLIKPFSEEVSKNIAEQYNLEYDNTHNIYTSNELPYLNGKETQQDFFKRVSKLLNIPYEQDILAKLFIEGVIPQQNMLNLIPKLHEKYELDLASNNYDELVAYINDAFELKKYFTQLLYSNEFGGLKTSSGYFDPILENSKPEECVFIDDQPENIAHGKKLGIHTIHFESYEQVVKELKALGVEL